MGWGNFASWLCGDLSWAMDVNGLGVLDSVKELQLQSQLIEAGVKLLVPFSSVDEFLAALDVKILSSMPHFLLSSDVGLIYNFVFSYFACM